jgi:hypothetical protein
MNHGQNPCSVFILTCLGDILRTITYTELVVGGGVLHISHFKTVGCYATETSPMFRHCNVLLTFLTSHGYKVSLYTKLRDVPRRTLLIFY